MLCGGRPWTIDHTNPVTETNMKAIAAAAVTALLALAPAPTHADEIADTIRAALEAYESGDVQYATDELAYAQQLLRELKASGLSGFLPPAPEGWTRTDDTEMSANMGFMGGGVGAKATYEKGGSRFEITLMADNPMVAAMGGMFANAAMMGMKQVRVGRERFADQDGQLTALIANRVLVQASGAPVDVMVPVLQEIDFAGLGSF
jgi:hypothetical protein